MLEIRSLDDIAVMRENSQVECKLAQGRDGTGALPEDIWETYSAFANTQGGDIFLGIREKSRHHFELAGIENTGRVLDDLWRIVNNPEKVSANILDENWVRVLEIDGKLIIHIHVPRASHLSRPIYIDGNPLTGSYQRLGSADKTLDAASVRRMLAEQLEGDSDQSML